MRPTFHDVCYALLGIVLGGTIASLGFFYMVASGFGFFPAWIPVAVTGVVLGLLGPWVVLGGTLLVLIGSAIFGAGVAEAAALVAGLLVASAAGRLLAIRLERRRQRRAIASHPGGS